LNPNAPPTFTDDGGETVTVIDFCRGKATFTGNVGNVTVAGDNGYIPAAALEHVGYVYDWNFDVSLDMADASRMGQYWKEFIPGEAEAAGGAGSYFIGVDSFFDNLVDEADSTQKYHLLQLFNYDPDQDQTGDHFNAWASLTGLNVNAPIGEVVKEPITFKVYGIPDFVANV